MEPVNAHGVGPFADLAGLHAVPAELLRPCLLYTSDAADERSSVDLGGRRIIKKNKKNKTKKTKHTTKKKKRIRRPESRQ